MKTEVVNINGDPWQPSAESLQKKVAQKRVGPAEFHKGWRVEGLPPGSLDGATELFNVEVRKAQSSRREPPEWEKDKYLAKFKLKPVRAKPYEIKDSAEQCKKLAERAGWILVQLREIKKEVGAI